MTDTPKPEELSAERLDEVDRACELTVEAPANRRLIHELTAECRRLRSADEMSSTSQERES